MGYSYGINPYTGYQVLACDKCSKSNGTTIKRHCPFGYCPSSAYCPDCWTEKKMNWKQTHKDYKCDEAAAAFTREHKELFHLYLTPYELERKNGRTYRILGRSKIEYPIRTIEDNRALATAERDAINTPELEKLGYWCVYSCQLVKRDGGIK